MYIRIPKKTQTMEKTPNKGIELTMAYNTSRAGGGLFGCILEVPGAFSQGKDLEELKENLKDAVKCIFESNRMDEEAKRHGLKTERFEMSTQD